MCKMNIEKIKDRILAINDYKNESRLTMVTKNVLNNVQYCIEECISNNIEGDFVETGVWKGGCVILANALYREHKEKRKVYCFDSFAGLPIPDVENYPMDRGDNHYTLSELAVSLEDVKKNFELFYELDENVVFVKGWFRDTLPKSTINKISVLRLDGDMYESTILALDNLYPKLSIGGFCIIDDYIHRGARAAVEDYRKLHNITDKVILADTDKNAYPVSYWIKSK